MKKSRADFFTICQPPILVIHEIIDLAIPLVDVGDGGGGAIGVFRGLACVEVGMLTVIVGDEAHVVGVGPAETEGLADGIRLDGRGVVGAREGVVETSTTDGDVGLVVVHVAGDGADRIGGGRGADKVAMQIV